LDRYLIMQRYGTVFLEADEAARLKKSSRRGYYRLLARETLRLRDRSFWQYHKDGLSELGEKLDRPYLALQVGMELLRIVSNPGRTIMRALKVMNKKVHLLQ